MWGHGRKSVLHYFIFAAGKRVTEDEVENMIESDNPAIFTQDVRVFLSSPLC